MSRCRSLLIALVATLLCAGSPGARALSTLCATCGPHCPMFAKRLGCHERTDRSHRNCHDRGGASLASCAHSGEAMYGVTWLATASAHTGVRLTPRIPDALASVEFRPRGETPEPP